MRIAFSARVGAAERAEWLQALRAACPGHDWREQWAPGEAFDAAVVANPEPGALQGLRGLRLVQSLWAGVERLLQDATLPPGVPLARMVDPTMNAAMAETAAWAVLSLHRGFFDYAAQQRQAQWLQRRQRLAAEVPVLVLGHGAMGAAVSRSLAALGYPVSAWRRVEPPAGTAGAPGTPGTPGIRLLHGTPALHQALAGTEVLINLLPLTPQTRGILGAPLFERLPRGASVVNLARGAHLVEAELQAALDAGHLRHAVLDVFDTEPLPPAHPFWAHPRVTVLPHVAALTDARSAAAVVADNLRRLQRGEPLAHLVDRARGY
jgi:glyoxylate/hydroxypyruvate reductase